MPEVDIREVKKRLRRTVRSRLADIDPQERRDASIAACRRLNAMPAVRGAGTVMLYMPLATEIDVLPAAVQCFQNGQTVCLPRVDWERRDMQPVEVRSFDDHAMETDPKSIRSPRDGRPVVPDAIDLIVVPALAYDVAGHRLGRGGGYYDRFMERLRPGVPRVGIVFDRQIVDEVPAEDHDIAVHTVVTERRLTG
ncbi:MAG: 5-formyltetrahydrofolate cyclo-ligase [Phycisphaerales bacterium]